jgi:probable rRNA maturation factor
VVVLKKRVAGLTETALMRFTNRARREAGLKGKVNVLVTSNAELRSLNRRFRRHDKPTDVLSFPGEPEAARAFAGDIAISAETASRNARALGHPLSSEIKILVLHGILHLRGYDHEGDRGEMARLELRLRRKLRLPVGLIERTESSAAARRNGASRRRRT